MGIYNKQKRLKPIRMVKEEGYWVDKKHNNKLSTKFYSEDEALIELTDIGNHGCTNCVNVVHSINCVNCVDCFGCINCIDCNGLEGDIGKERNV